MDNTNVRKEQAASEDTVPVLPSSPRADNDFSKGLGFGWSYWHPERFSRTWLNATNSILENKCMEIPYLPFLL